MHHLSRYWTRHIKTRLISILHSRNPCEEQWRLRHEGRREGVRLNVVEMLIEVVQLLVVFAIEHVDEKRLDDMGALRFVIRHRPMIRIRIGDTGIELHIAIDDDVSTDRTDAYFERQDVVELHHFT